MDEYTYRESQRLASMLYYDPHNAAQEMREELANSTPGEARDLIRATKQVSSQYAPGAGELVIDVERTPDGCDSGFRNVYVATQDGPDQVAELQVKNPVCQPGDPGYQGNPGYGIGDVDQFGRPIDPRYDPTYQVDPRYDPRYQGDQGYYGRGFDPLSAVEGMIIGSLLFHNRGQFRDGDEWREREWREREERREMYWNNQRQQGTWQQNWNNQNYRNQWREKPYSFIDRDDDHWRRPDQNRPGYRPPVSQTLPFQNPGRQVIPGQIEQPRIILPNQGVPNGRVYNGGQERHFDDDRNRGQRIVPQPGFQGAPVDNGAALRAQQQRQNEEAMRLQQQQEANRRALQQQQNEAAMRAQQQQEAARRAQEMQEANRRAIESQQHQQRFVPVAPATPPASVPGQERRGNMPNYQQWRKP